jgi:DNA-binding GntR family transcriptional regulator
MIDKITSRAGSSSALVDALAAEIRERVLSGDIPIGAPLRQAALADEFGVSRMPVREAIRQLQHGGLITVSPNRGAVVRVPTPWEVRESYEIRAELEALAARRAAGRVASAQLAELREVNAQMRGRMADKDADVSLEPGRRHRGSETFHHLIASSAANERLARAISELNEAFPRNILVQLLREDPRYCEVNFDEHDAIVDALQSADPERAGALMRSHVLQAGEHLARWFERRSTTTFRGTSSGG